VTISGPGSISLNGGVTTTGAQTYGAAVTLGAATALGSTNAGNISLGSTIDGAHALTVNTGGVATFGGGAVGGTTPLLSLNVVSSGIALGDAIATTTTQKYQGPVTLQAATTLTSPGNVVFLGAVNGAFALNITGGGTSTFDGAIGGRTPLASLSAGITNLKGGTVATTGDQLYAGAATLGAATTLASANGNISLGGTVDGAQALTVHASGATTFGAALGGATPLASLSTGGTGTVALNGGAVTTTGTQTYNNAVTLGAATALSASTATFANQLNLGTNTLADTGNFALTPAATFAPTLAGTTSAEFGHLTHTGTAALAGAALSVTRAASFTPSDGTTFDLIGQNGGGALTGAFAGAAEGTLLNVSQMTFSVTYKAGAQGQDVAVATQFGLPDHLAFVQQPLAGVAGVALGAVAVAAEDNQNAVLPLSSATISLAATGPGALANTASAPATAGVATFGNVVLQKAGTYTLSASAAGVPSIASASFTIAPAAPAQISFAVPPPASGTAGTALPALPVLVQDAFGNASAGGFSLNVAATGPGGFSAGSTSVPVAADGVATFAGLVLPKAGSYSLQISGAGLKTLHAPLTISPAAPSVLSFTAGPSSVTAGQALPTLAVAVQDAFGNSVSGAAVNLSASGPGSFTAATPATQAVNGVATFAGLSLQAAGPYTVLANLPGLSPVPSARFAVAPAAATQLAFETTPANLVAGQALPALAIDVRDAFGNLVTTANDAVTLTVARGNVSAGTATVSAVGGVATFSGLTLQTAGTYTLSLTAAGLTSPAVATFIVTPAAPSQLVFPINPADSTAGQSLPDLAVNVADAFGNPIAGVPITLTINGPGNLSAGTTAAPSVAGVATFSGLTLLKAGTYTFTATSPGVTATLSTPFQILPGAPGQLLVAANPKTAIAGQALASPSAEILDLFGNPVNGPVPVSLTVNGPGALVAGSTSTPTVSGVAAFPGLTFDKAGIYTLTFNSPGLTAAATTPFVVSPAGASQLAFVINPPLSTSTAGQVLPDIEVVVFDAFGNLAPDHIPIALTVNGPGGPAAGSTSAATANGMADFRGLILQTAGTYTLTVSAPGATAATSAGFTITAAAARQLAFEPLPLSGTAAQTLPTLKVDVEDAFGNLAASSAPITLTVNGPAAPTAGIQTAQASGGVAYFSGLVVPQSGNYAFFASALNLSPALSGNLAILSAPASPSTTGLDTNPLPRTSGSTTTPGAAARLRFLSAPETVPTGRAFLVRLQVLDAHGHAVKAGTLINIHLASGKLRGTLREHTDKNGIVSFSGLSILKAGRYTLLASTAGLHATAALRITILPAHT
jgi:hypothetical protein